MQRSASITWTFFGSPAMAFTGQTRLQMPQALHRSSLTEKVMSAVQTGNGLGLMLLAGRPGKTLAPLLIALGTLAAAAMIWIIAFTGAHPFDPAVPIGGMAMVLGWLIVAAGRD